MRNLRQAFAALVVVVGTAMSAALQAQTPEPRQTYIVSFGLFGPESVFASEAEKAAEILRARLQPDAQIVLRANDKRGGSATSATLAAALRSAGRAMDRDNVFWSSS